MEVSERCVEGAQEKSQQGGTVVWGVVESQ